MKSADLLLMQWQIRCQKLKIELVQLQFLYAQVISGCAELIG
jgi:hypothetical protein